MIRTTLREICSNVVGADEGGRALVGRGMGCRQAHGRDQPIGPHRRHDGGGLVHALRPLMGVPDHDRGQVQDRGLLGQGAAVGDDTEGVALDLDVVDEAEGRQESEPGIERHSLQTLARSRMGGDNHGLAEQRRDGAKAGQQLLQARRIVHRLLAMRADDEIGLGLQCESSQNAGGFNGSLVMGQDLGHGRADGEDAVFRQTLGQEKPAGMLAMGHVDVAQMIDDAAVDLLRDTEIEATVAGLKMEDRDAAALRRDHRKAGIGVAVDQHRIGPDGLEQAVAPPDDFGDGVGGTRSRSGEPVVRAPNFELVEEYVAQSGLIVLAGMDEDVARVSVELGNDPAELDQFGPCAENRHHRRPGRRGRHYEATARIVRGPSSPMKPLTLRSL